MGTTWSFRTGNLWANPSSVRSGPHLQGDTAPAAAVRTAWHSGESQLEGKNMAKVTTLTKDMTIAHPKIVSEDEWRAVREEHLTHEKEITRKLDKLHAERRRLPMVRVEKNYVFEGPEGKRTLGELFDDRRQ